MADGRAQRLGFGPRFLTPVLLGPALNPINTTMISVALVPISRATGTPASLTIWLVAGLYLVSAIAQPTMGRLADLFGPRRIYLTGFTIAGLGGLIPLFWPTFGGALVSRVAIGIGTSSAYPASITSINDQARRLGVKAPQTVLSAVSVSSLVTTAIGPVLGGVLIEHRGWASIFLINTPYAAVAVAAALLWLPSDRTRQTANAQTRGARALDLPGIALFTVGIVALLVFLLDVRAGLSCLVALAVICLAGLIARERRIASPFIDVRMIAGNRPLARTYLRYFLLYTCIYLVTYAFTQWLQAVDGFTSDRAGLMQLAAVACAGAATIVVSRTPRVRLPLIVAAAVPVGGGLLLTAVHAHSPLWLLIITIALFGIPQGLGSVSNQTAMYHQAPASQMGSASGLSRTGIYLGALVASSLIGPIFGSRATDTGMHAIAWIIVGLATAALVLTLADRSLAQAHATEAH